jgi:hypothetical protein
MLSITGSDDWRDVDWEAHHELHPQGLVFIKVKCVVEAARQLKRAPPDHYAAGARNMA